ncbi:protein FAM183A [Polypterus senegalus]
MAGKGKERDKDPVDFVHQNAILCETIRKEQHCHKIYTTFNINQFTKLYPLTGKPMSKEASQDNEEDENFLKLIHKARLEPTKKFTHPQTESQEIGWITTPLTTVDHTDRRLNFHRKNSEITTYMEAAWLKEQTQNLA